MRDIPQIDNGKKPLQPLNIVHFIWLPSSTPYGNLLLKGMNIVRRIDRVNLEKVKYSHRMSIPAKRTSIIHNRTYSNTNFMKNKWSIGYARLLTSSYHSHMSLMNGIEPESGRCL